MEICSDLQSKSPAEDDLNSLSLKEWLSYIKKTQQKLESRGLTRDSVYNDISSLYQRCTALFNSQVVDTADGIKLLQSKARFEHAHARCKEAERSYEWGLTKPVPDAGFYIDYAMFQLSLGHKQQAGDILLKGLDNEAQPKKAIALALSEIGGSDCRVSPLRSITKLIEDNALGCSSPVSSAEGLPQRVPVLERFIFPPRDSAEKSRGTQTWVTRETLPVGSSHMPPCSSPNASLIASSRSRGSDITPWPNSHRRYPPKHRCPVTVHKHPNLKPTIQGNVAPKALGFGDVVGKTRQRTQSCGTDVLDGEMDSLGGVFCGGVDSDGVDSGGVDNGAGLVGGGMDVNSGVLQVAGPTNDTETTCHPEIVPFCDRLETAIISEKPNRLNKTDTRTLTSCKEDVDHPPSRGVGTESYRVNDTNRMTVSNRQIDNHQTVIDRQTDNKQTVIDRQTDNQQTVIDRQTDNQHELKNSTGPQATAISCTDVVQYRTRPLAVRDTTNKENEPCDNAIRSHHRDNPGAKPELRKSIIASPSGHNVFTMDSVAFNGHVYMILKLLGKGGSSNVYQVLDDRRQIYALKIVDLKDEDDENKALFISEVDTLSKLQDTGKVIKVIDYDISSDRILLVMECGSTDLAHFLRSKHCGINCRARSVWLEILELVAAIHSRGVIHTDLKPANFLFVNGRLKLIDFGIANNLAKDMTSIYKWSQPGTLSYMSPEALDPKDCAQLRISRKSDVWSLGIILYYMIFGKTPFQSIGNAYQRSKAILSAPIAFPEGHCSSSVLETARVCLQRDQTKRPSVEQLIRNIFPCEDR